VQYENQRQEKKSPHAAPRDHDDTNLYQEEEVPRRSNKDTMLPGSSDSRITGSPETSHDEPKCLE
jgi:hypothetical protein